MPKLTINGTELEVPAGTSILQAAEMLGVEIPRFCFHDRLSVPANCRMCLVEVEKTPKPQASCALPCADGMVVHTDSAVVHKARKGVLEMLLINHPLDCPICDQGGECDLQDQTMAYGFDRGRFAENKRAVKDKELGPLIKTVMTRCIHCTRCVRFADEIAGSPDMGMTGRGEDVEIGTYIERSVANELSGNMIDVCPVGALTNKPYAFAARPWELTKTESIDVTDAVGSNIRIDARGREVLRVLPRLHEGINEEWISDKSRFACDGLRYQRLDRPFVRLQGKLQPATWEQALALAAQKIKEAAPQRMAALAGDLVDVESSFALREILDSLAVPHRDCRAPGERYDVTNLMAYRFNTGIAQLEEADVVLLVGCDIRFEAPMVAARLRKRWRQGGLSVATIGPPVDLTHPARALGDGPKALKDLLAGKGDFATTLRAAKNPVIILGMAAVTRPDGVAVQSLALQVAAQYGMLREDWTGFNLLQNAAGRMGALSVGFLPLAGGMGTDAILAAAGKNEIGVLVLMGMDQIDPKALAQSFVIYVGHHGDRAASRADIILPACAYTEKNAIYVNAEGRPQYARAAVSPPGEAREDWKIMRALSDALGKPLAYNTLGELRRQLFAERPMIGQIDVIRSVPRAALGEAGQVSDSPFGYVIENFYMTDPICRASPTMAQCAREFWPRLSAVRSLPIAAEE